MGEMTVPTLGKKCIAALLLALLSNVAFAYQITGRVISVTDGDTLVIREDQTNHRIRLSSIDAPERGSGSNRPGQPYSNASRDFLAQQVAGKTLTLICFEADRYGRHVCDVPVGEATVNQLLVAAGLAWAYRQGNDKFLRDKTLIQLQEQVKAEKKGLWADPKPIEPWQWRIKCWGQGQCAP